MDDGGCDAGGDGCGGAGDSGSGSVDSIDSCGIDFCNHGNVIDEAEQHGDVMFGFLPLCTIFQLPLRCL